MRLLLKKTSGLLLKLYNEKNDAVIGKVLSPHGIGGQVKVFPYSDNPERINLLVKVELCLGSERRFFEVDKASIHGRFWLIKFKGIDSRSDAARIRDSLVLIPKQDRMLLPEGSFYHDQLIGLQVYSFDGDLLGSISEMVTTGGHDLFLIVRHDREDEKKLIPAVKKFVRQIDLKKGIMVVDLPEGLLDL